MVASDPVSASSTDDPIFMLWHRRLGHPSVPVVKFVLNTCQVIFHTSGSTNVCVACQKGKFHKLHFTSSTTEYTEPFVLVVSDLSGPTSVASGTHWYYVSFIDICTHYTWIYLLQHKSQALECFL